MSKKIVWSPLSVNDFDNILEYLNNNWDRRVTNHFIDLTGDSIKQILENPRQFPVIFKKGKI
jgi:plasmid stabilization system protein ParE